MSHGRLGTVKQVFDHGVMEPADDQREEQPVNATWLSFEDVAHESGAVGEGFHLQCMPSGQQGGRLEAEDDAPAGLVSTDGVADDGVTAAGAHFDRSIESHRHPEMGGP
ncbi:MAG TPA: hypothetical protein VNB24_09995 [Acidimicrobiales bacterium]|nr:hypothetical protein [Acidimicrobiales bacterium]